MVQTLMMRECWLRLSHTQPLLPQSNLSSSGEFKRSMLTVCSEQNLDQKLASPEDFMATVTRRSPTRLVANKNVIATIVPDMTTTSDRFHRIVPDLSE